MSVKIDIRASVDELTKTMNKLAKQQMPYAVSKAINVMVDAGKKAAERQIATLDNPVAFTKRAVFVSYSNKAKRPITGMVGIKDIQAGYLQYMEEGGVSPASGKAKPVPASSAKNTAGNMPKGKVKKVLSDTEKYFTGTPKGGGRPGGIYQRLGKRQARKRVRNGQTGSVYRSHQLKQVAHWEESTHHTAKIRIGERIRVITERKIRAEITRQVNAAMRS